MDYSFPLNQVRVDLCVIFNNVHFKEDRELVWSNAAIDFIKKVNRLGINVCLIGPRPPQKFGSKKNFIFLDRHETVLLKELEVSKNHSIEIKVINKKNKSWTRVRAESCIVFGDEGNWPEFFPGWNGQWTIPFNTLSRLFHEFKWIPGKEFIFVGSNNRVVRMATTLLELGAKQCFVVESQSRAQCWRGYEDLFVQKGGRFFFESKINRVESKEAGSEVYIATKQGVLISSSDIIVLDQNNSYGISSPDQWKRGLIYLQRRSDLSDLNKDEENILEELDWNEAFFRIARHLEKLPYSSVEAGLEQIKKRRKMLFDLRRNPQRIEVKYSGKILERNSLAEIQTSPSVPRTFQTTKPKASLECLEKIACRACADACPENAIEIQNLLDLPKLLEDKCTGCGICVSICPSRSALMIQESSKEHKAKYYFASSNFHHIETGKTATLINRKGDALGSARVLQTMIFQHGLHKVVELESSSVYLWEARGFKSDSIQIALDFIEEKTPRGWIELNGKKRLSPMNLPFTVAFRKIGVRRFEDSLFCRDGGCQRCEITVNGRKVLACQTTVQEGMKVQYDTETLAVKIDQTKPQEVTLCPCSKVSETEFKKNCDEVKDKNLARECTNLGYGKCHGRWCLSSTVFQDQKNNRPIFHGFEDNLWKDFSLEEILYSKDSQAKD